MMRRTMACFAVLGIGLSVLSFAGCSDSKDATVDKASPEQKKEQDEYTAKMRGGSGGAPAPTGETKK